MSTIIASLVTIVISKKENNKRVELGKMEVPVPTLKDFGIDVEPTKVEEDGRPVYASDAHQWLYNAIHQLATKKARNSLEVGTMDFKAGVEGFSTTLESLCAPAVGGGNPEAALAITALKNAFKSYLAGLGLGAQAQAFLNAQVAAPKNLALQPAAMREKIQARLEGFIEANEESDALANSYAMNYLQKLLEACDADEVSLDDL